MHLFTLTKTALLIFKKLHMRIIKCTLLVSALFLTLTEFAQKSQPKFKFGDVKPEDFEPKVYDIDSSANAVILADIGNSEFEGNSKGDFSLIYTHQRRIRIINKNGFDIATI